MVYLANSSINFSTLESYIINDEFVKKIDAVLIMAYKSPEHNT